MTTSDDELERLRRRLDRERRARRQAEIIAERGMRELWAANAELRERVTTRTAELECSIRALQLTERARSKVVERFLASGSESTSSARVEAGDDPGRETLERIRSLVLPPVSTVTDPVFVDIDPVDFADRLVDRWQHPAARVGQLLSVEVTERATANTRDWALVRAIADTVLDGCVRHSRPGALIVTLSAGSDGVGLSIRDSGPGLDAERLAVARERPSRWWAVGPAGDHCALVQALCEEGAVRWSVDSDGFSTLTSVLVASA